MIKTIKQKIKPYIDPYPELPLDPNAVQLGVYKWPPHFQPIFLVYVFAGGCIGTLLRYSVSQLVAVTTWPVATIIVNLTGAFILGFLLETLALRGKDKGIRRTMRLFAGTGILGAYTTYSTFAIDTQTLITAQGVESTLLYIAITITGGVLLSGIGVHLAAKHHESRGVTV